MLPHMDDPTLERYRPTDRPEVFDFLTNTFSAAESTRIITQWPWKYESNPFNPPEGPLVFVMRSGTKVVSLVAGFRLPTLIAGSICEAENLGTWVVHRDYRRQRIWQQVDRERIYQAPIAIAWGRRLSARIGIKNGWMPSPMNALLRILDSAPIIEHLSGSRSLARLGTAANATARVIAAPFRRKHGNIGTITRLQKFDERSDALWERAHRDGLAMVIRNRRYLQWRYIDRPDATYSLFGVERGSELMGILVARTTTRNGVPWGYLVDFLVARNNAEGVLAMLIDAALDDFRRSGAAAASCYASDTYCRHTLMFHGFVPAPQRDPIHFSLKIHPQRSDLSHFATPRLWYVTMGDGDLELAA
jgi:hypothetical protein